MYNAQIKLRFIQKYTSSEQTAKLLRRLFNSTACFEKKYDTDFSEMNVAQTQETFNHVSGIKVNGAGTILMILKAYVRWCTANGYTASTAIHHVRIDVHDKLRDSYVASPEHLKLALNAAFPNPELNEIEYIYRSFLWLAFMGFQVPEAILVTEDALDFSMLCVHSPDNTVRCTIYPESIPDLRKAVELRAFREPKGRFTATKQRSEGTAILRGKISKRSLEEVVEVTFRPTISRAFSEAVERYKSMDMEIPIELSLKLSFKHVYMSGIFYRVYEKERMGIRPDFESIVTHERRNAKESNFSQNYTERKLLNVLIRNLEQDYLNWKSVFG